RGDPSVASMKGVILSIDPGIALVDISHDIPRHAVAAGAYVLSMAARYFPAGTIHLAVVDPGVGGARRPVVCSAGTQRYVGPDNGLFDAISRRDPDARWYEIREVRYCLKPPADSPTFQGRDVFAPVAAWLAHGTAPEAFGPPIDDPIRLAAPQDRALDGEIVWIDRFGNLISNLAAPPGPRARAVAIAGHKIPLVTHYAAGPSGAPAALINSDDLLEVFVNQGDAASALQVSIGTPISWIES
ncbi:MAG: SAM-dependent chlorinase/fluorinase, partial [Nitrospiria bacterium]